MNKKGHLFALFTLIVWGTTYVASKIILKYMTPVELLLMRFIMGYILLWVLYPKPLKVPSRQEMYFALAGLTGIYLYYLMENIALTYTRASNVSIVLSAAPLLTAILSKIIHRDKEHIGVSFFVGFVVAIIGICFVSLREATVEINPFGDFLALVAAFIWAVYSVVSRKVATFGYNSIAATRRMFFYGLVVMIPTVLVSGFDVSRDVLTNPEIILSMVYLGCIASGICFVTWNIAVRYLGAVKTSAYIYLQPFVTVAASAVLIGERLDLRTGIGMALILIGLILSEMDKIRKSSNNKLR